MTAGRRAARAAGIAGAVILAAWAGLTLPRRFRRGPPPSPAPAVAAAPTAAPIAPPAPEAPPLPPPVSMPFPDAPVDFALWSPRRVRAYEASLAEDLGAPIAALRVPRIGLEVAVLPGTSEAALDRASGWIERTARPGQAGNVGIAGHRDGFFRGLKDIAVGDDLELRLPGGESETFCVEEIRIVTPRDVGVLADTAEPTLTLVTCYPFYFAGSAPDRFIVRAVRSDRAQAAPAHRAP